LQLFTTNHLGMRMSASRAGTIGRRGFEVVAAIPTTMPDGQDLDRKLSAFRDRASGCDRKSRLQAIKVKHPASANCEVNG